MKPLQEIYKDERGVYRFKENKICRYLIDHGNIDLNKIAVLDFSDEDREQFAQLIGYSINGFADLSYVSDEAYDIAQNIMYEMIEEENLKENKNETTNKKTN